jgi:hypothetical protein
MGHQIEEECSRRKLRGQTINEAFNSQLSSTARRVEELASCGMSKS